MTATRHTSSRRGYVLMMALVLLVIITTAFTAAARRHLRIAAAASMAQVELQRRWGAFTCADTLLPMARDILHAGNEQADEPVIILRHSLILGGQHVDLILGDEQAKLNVNTLLTTLEPAAVEELIAAIVTGDEPPTTVSRARAAKRYAITLRPYLWDQSAGDEPPSGIASFGQIFDEPPLPDELLALQPVHAATHSPIFNRDVIAGPAARLTCWGDGRVNVTHAADDTIEALLSAHLTRIEIHRLLTLRHEHAELDIDNLLAGTQLDKDSASVIKQLLTDESRCLSLWVGCRTVRRGDAERDKPQQRQAPGFASAWRLFVAIEDDDQSTQWHSFSW